MCIHGRFSNIQSQILFQKINVRRYVLTYTIHNHNENCTGSTTFFHCMESVKYNDELYLTT